MIEYYVEARRPSAQLNGGVEMRMIDEKDRIVTVTEMSEDAFRTFLSTGDEMPAYTRKIRETDSAKYGRVITQFSGTLSICHPGKWYITARDDDAIMLSSTLQEAMKAHDKLTE